MQSFLLKSLMSSIGVKGLTFASGSEFSPLFSRSRREARILTLLADRSTYEVEPDDAAFEAWREAFDADSRKNEISELLVTNGDVRGHYTRLVPNAMLHRDFWARYFFRLEILEREEARWDALKERAGRQVREREN